MHRYLSPRHLPLPLTITQVFVSQVCTFACHLMSCMNVSAVPGTTQTTISSLVGLVYLVSKKPFCMHKGEWEETEGSPQTASLEQIKCHKAKDVYSDRHEIRIHHLLIISVVAEPLYRMSRNRLYIYKF